MDSSAGLRKLGSLDCRERLAAARIGRLIWNEGAQPTALPVNYVLHAGTILIRSGTGGKLGAAARGAHVAFLVDDLDTDGVRPWSVLAKGRARVLTDEEFAAAAELPLEPDAGTLDRDHFIAITIDELTGRELEGFRFFR